MIIAPSSFIGFDGAYKGRVAYAIGGFTDFRTTYRASPDGRSFYQRPARGAIVDGAPFRCMKMMAFAGQVVMVGFFDDGVRFVGAAFRSADGEVWTRIPLPIDSSGSANKLYVDMASNGAQLCLLMNTGERAVTTDLVSWSTFGNLGFMGAASINGPASCIAAAGNIWLAGGAGGQLFRATSPGGSWSAVNSSFGNIAITKVVAGDAFVIVGTGMIGKSAINDGSQWSLRADPVGGGNSYLGFFSGTWFLSGFSGKWLRSVNAGDVWSPTASTPDPFYVDAALDIDGVIVTVGGAGVSISRDKLTWQRLGMRGLPQARLYGFSPVPANLS